MIADAAATADAGAPVVLPFSPGDGQAYRLEVEHRRDPPATPMRFTTVSTVRFARDGDGWTMTLVLDEARSTAGPRADAVFATGKRPFLGVPIVARVDADGRILDIRDEAELWARFRAAQEEIAPIVAADASRPAVDRATVAAVVRAVLDGPPALRRQHLLGDIEPMLGLAGRTLHAGRPVPVAGTTGGAAGTVALVTAEPGHADVRIETRSGAGALERVADVRDARIDRRTGLTAHDRRVRTVGDADASNVMVEIRRLTPLSD